MDTLPSQKSYSCALHFWNWFVWRTGTNNEIKLLMNAPLIQDNLSGGYRLATSKLYKWTGEGAMQDMLYLLNHVIYQD